ncbi:MAG: two-component system response regulator [Bdellovibrionaceae bacterium]|nr:two-component system response regulator [Pseudobdellovibrionaceae bacterium]|tara:strand:+ start:372 stop:767 length:396 start_codon:yes stop_codon:yes gene_type:complete
MFQKNAQILCVDDTRTVHEMLEKLLKELGFSNLHFASHADDAAEILNSNSEIELVICDINMPDKTGLDLLKGVRNHPNFATLPFIMLTMENDLKTVNKAIELGISGYLLKPVNRDALEKGMINAYKKREGR